MPKTQPKLTSMFRVQTLLLLDSKIPKSGYDLSKELEKNMGKKPSSGKMYPFLKELRESDMIHEIDDADESGRNKTAYLLTEKGLKFRNDIVDKMSTLMDIRLQEKLDRCYHCGAQIYEAKVEGTVDGLDVMFCCTHCRGAYEEKVDVHH